MFKKNMLQEGDIIECANGDFYRYTRCFPLSHAPQFRLLGHRGWLDLESYDDNLTLNQNQFLSQEIIKLFTIVNIYRNVSKYFLSRASLYSTRLDGSFPNLFRLTRSPNYIPFKKWGCTDNFINLRYYV